jgi:hypothetical protein
MLRSAFLMMGLIVLTTVSSASAAAVNFRGTLTSNPLSGGTLSLPLADFDAIVYTGAPLGSNAFVTGGFFDFNGTIVNINGGIVSITAGNTISFTLLSPSNVTSTFSFTGVTGLGGTVNQAAFDALTPPPFRTTAFQIFQTDGGANVLASYGGDISSVPEPGSMIALAGLAFGAGAWRLRKRKQAAKA